MAFRPPVDVRGWILTSTTEVVVRLYLLGHGWVLPAITWAWLGVNSYYLGMAGC